MNNGPIHVPTKKELKLIKDYIKEEDFWKSDSKEEVMDMFLVLVGYGLEAEKAVSNISALVSSIKNEYGD